MRYSIVEYVADVGVYYLRKAYYEQSNSDVMKYLRSFNEPAVDDITIYAGLSDEIFEINIKEKYYRNDNLNCDKSLYDYLRNLEKQLEKRGYINGTTNF